MKRAILTLMLLSFAGIALAQPGAAVYYGQNNVWLDATNLVWSQDPANKTDTITCTGTAQLSAPFQIYNGNLAVYWKAKFSSAGADTDTVQITLLNSAYQSASTTAGPSYRWIRVDSTIHGGRADTLYKRHVFNLHGDYGIWWTLELKKRKGVPKLMDFSRNTQ